METGFRAIKRNVLGQTYWQRAREFYEKAVCPECKRGAGGHYGKLGENGQWEFVCKQERENA